MTDRVPFVMNVIRTLPDKAPLLIALDGRCASGKTTLACELSQRLDCPVFHMDDFFLQPAQRTPERLAVPGGNVEHERFLREVLLPLSRGEDVQYRRFDCSTQTLLPPVTVPCGRVNLIEGSYSCHPALRPYYDLRVLLTLSPDEQLRRLTARSPEKVPVFLAKWIPLEEAYFQACGVAAACDVLL